MERDLNANEGRYHIHAIKIIYEGNKMQMKELLKLALTITILAIFSLTPWCAFSQECPEGCQCISEENATKMFGEGNYQLCQKTPCGEERSASSGAIIPKYCINSICPCGCFCLNQYEAKHLGLEPCSNEMVSCGIDPIGTPEYCFAPAVNCSPGCLCVTEREANVFGLKELCQNQRIECGRGDIKYCFKVPKYACPAGCTCLSKEEASDKGLTDMCLDQAKNPILCEVIDAEKGIVKFCYMQPDQK
jgi:hypothetical protein